MVVCVWCHCAIADDGRVTMTSDICEECLAPVGVRIAESRRRAEALRRQRWAEEREFSLAGSRR